MIKKIHIQNIQSHKDSTLELSPGINAIVGSSNNGKSAILRAFYWVRYNRPLGVDNLLSHWACDKKGNQIAVMEASIENENGVVTRRRTKNENQYIVNDEELNVVKTDVPSQVEQLLQLSDTNIQRQQDAPFLLSLTSGQVAQYFNKTVRLDIIDRVLSNAESKRRKTMQEISQSEELLKEKESKLEEYAWLAEAEKLIIKCENISAKAQANKEKAEILKQQIEEYEACDAVKNKFNFIVKAKKIIESVEDNRNVLQQITSRIDVMNESLQEAENCEKSIYPSFDKQKTLIQKINALDTKEIKEKINCIKEQVEDFEILQHEIKDEKETVKTLTKQLPKVCPLCGGILNENGKCENE